MWNKRQVTLDTEPIRGLQFRRPKGRHVKGFEVYMKLVDRKRLARMIAIQEVSKREVARAAGWKSHTYLLRLLSGAVTTCEPEHAVKIATFLGCDVGDLFVPRKTSAACPTGSGRTTKKGRAA